VGENLKKKANFHRQKIANYNTYYELLLLWLVTACLVHTDNHLSGYDVCTLVWSALQ